MACTVQLAFLSGSGNWELNPRAPAFYLVSRKPVSFPSRTSKDRGVAALRCLWIQCHLPPNWGYLQSERLSKEKHPSLNQIRDVVPPPWTVPFGDHVRPPCTEPGTTGSPGRNALGPPLCASCSLCLEAFSFPTHTSGQLSLSPQHSP